MNSWPLNVVVERERSRKPHEFVSIIIFREPSSSEDFALLKFGLSIISPTVTLMLMYIYSNDVFDDYGFLMFGNDLEIWMILYICFE